MATIATGYKSDCQTVAKRDNNIPLFSSFWFDFDMFCAPL